ncbi:DNA alkylation repair protein [Caldibacillus thermolactis]|jgi:rubredoxin|uniref:DNA alkylation repair protein n=1 Tax=Pallidibacillus thermolactis TaxID=251051 RepID=A0ABT2WJ69_9BACI|nr:DNA alkylation repair protein [Pallidibacillus thermolactis]MCU9595747.1 DNA alkylation repair protein [Pallidibacillus thermolactis]MCU9602007.1 DNA alkylation repair protein [Pallidibacillus thermolactis subsp. kokeshiiformis]MED1673600.1 DNA alkylation repair protein [Pallidibacillus thermolactis subsp. kokeshiiformis]
MPTPYRCPNCKTNKTRFNFIKQVPEFVKVDPETGEVLEIYDNTQLDPFHLPYNGPDIKIQCAVCGLIEDEKMFAKFGESSIQ